MELDDVLSNDEQDDIYFFVNQIHEMGQEYMVQYTYTKFEILNCCYGQIDIEDFASRSYEASNYAYEHILSGYNENQRKN